MAFVIPLCKNIPISTQLCFPTPTGGKICSPMGLGTGDLTAIIQAQLGLLSSFFGALGPFFVLLDAVSTLIECIQGIKDAIGPPPDPSKLIKCLEKLVKLAQQLAAILPQIWVPKAIKAFLELILMGLAALIGEMQSFLRQQQRLAALALSASKPGNASLGIILNCAQNNYQITVGNTQTGFGPLNQLIEIMNGFMTLIGLPKDLQIPSLSMGGGDPSEAIAELQKTITFLQDLLTKIPI